MAVFTGAGVAIVTPFHADESINYDKLDELIDYHCENGTDSIIICGTTGESATMTEEEHMECVGAPIYNQEGRVLGAISASSLYKPEEDYQGLGEKVKAKAEEISKVLGYSAGEMRS